MYLYSEKASTIKICEICSSWGKELSLDRKCFVNKEIFLWQLVDKRLRGMVITPGQQESDSDEEFRNAPEDGEFSEASPHCVNDIRRTLNTYQVKIVSWYYLQSNRSQSEKQISLN